MLAIASCVMLATSVAIVVAVVEAKGSDQSSYSDISLFGASFDRPSSGNALWYRTPAANWVMESLPIGNGFMGAAIFGGVENDTVAMNIDDLWIGGPFDDPAYNGGNWVKSDAPAVQGRMNQLRATIFQNGTASNLNNVGFDPGAYGSFSSAGNLQVVRSGLAQNYTEYLRWLDLDQGMIRSSWTEGTARFRREYICSYPAKVCSHMTSSTQPMATTNYGIQPTQGHTNVSQTCIGNSTIVHRAYVGTVSADSKGTGMTYEIVGKVLSASGSGSSVKCSGGVITVRNATDIWFVWSGGTEYNIQAGTAASNYSFKGPDPHAAVSSSINSLSSTSYSTFVKAHATDFVGGLNTNFKLDLGQKQDGWARSTDELMAMYRATSTSSDTRDAGRTLLEWVLFNYGRYLIFSSARGVVPANLQGVWSNGQYAPWSGDYHANINVQMMYWPVEMTGMDITQTLWDFIEKTIIPQGQGTAFTMYGVSQGWVMHDEINIFGATGMKAFDDPSYNPAEWANYAASGAWLMTHAWDHFDYTGDVQWLKRQGYPLLKSTAQYWLGALQVDQYSKDDSLVVNPCNSPELPQTTFGCSHWQQMIWELFNSVEKALAILGSNTDSKFLSDVKAARIKVDRGLRIGSAGQLQEWKLDLDNSGRLTHRHLSPLTGLYPSYSISTFNPISDGLHPANLTRKSLLDASKILLTQRGNGTSPDADSGWAKMWRAACWVQFADADKFYSQLSYGVGRNFATNLWSLYNPYTQGPEDLFQMDANGGFTAAVLNALIQMPDTQLLTDTLTITLLPALPPAWSTGSLRGVRLRRGLEVDMNWRNESLTAAVLTARRLPPGTSIKIVVNGAGVSKTFALKRGDSVQIK